MTDGDPTCVTGPEAKFFHEPQQGCGLAQSWRGPGCQGCDLPDDKACPWVGGGGRGGQAAVATVPASDSEQLGSCQEHALLGLLSLKL